MIHSRYLDRNLSQALDHQINYEAHRRKLNEIQKERTGLKKKNKTKDVDYMMARQFRLKLRSNDFQENERLNDIKRTNQLMLEKLLEISKGKWSTVRSKHNISKSVGPTSATTLPPATRLHSGGPSGPLDTLSTTGQKSLLSGQRKKKQQNIDHENQILLQRILSQSSELSKKRLEKEYEKKRQYRELVQYTNKIPFTRMTRKGKTKLSPSPSELPPITSTRTPLQFSTVGRCDSQQKGQSEDTTSFTINEGEGFPSGFTKFVDEQEMRDFRHPLTSRNQITAQTVKLKKSSGMKSSENLIKDNNSSSPSSRVTSTFSRNKVQEKIKATKITERKVFKNAYSSKIGVSPVKTQASSSKLNKELKSSKSNQNLHQNADLLMTAESKKSKELQEEAERSAQSRVSIEQEIKEEVESDIEDRRKERAIDVIKERTEEDVGGMNQEIQEEEQESKDVTEDYLNQEFDDTPVEETPPQAQQVREKSPGQEEKKQATISEEEPHYSSDEFDF